MSVVEFHSNEKLTEAMWRFLRTLNAGADLPPVMNRLEDRARQKACRNGFASYIRTGPHRGWKITAEGVQALMSLDTQR